MSYPSPSVPTAVAVEMADDADDDPSQDGVGFESTTVLYDTESRHRTGLSNSTSGINNNSSSNSNNNTGEALMSAAEAGVASPYAYYEPLHAQQQHGILGGGGGSEVSSASVFPAPSSSPHLPQIAGPALSPGIIASLPIDSAGAGVGILGAAAASAMPPIYSSTQHPPAVMMSGGEIEGHAPQAVPHRSSAYVEEGLDVPLHAPRLRVPTDLPLEQTTLMDLLATMVVQGGPTTEEEIAKRELGRHNPAFAFLGEKFNHPCLLYYRWRLYSLLQQDTLLSWRTTPFQVEQARRAYAFVPPPQLYVGPECLQGLHQPELFQSESSGVSLRGGGGGSKRAREDGAEGDDEAGSGDEIVTRKSRKHRHRRKHRHAHRSGAAETAALAQEGEGENEAQQQREAEQKKKSKHEGRKRHRQSRDASKSPSSSSSSSDSSNSSSSSDDDADEDGTTAQTLHKEDAANAGSQGFDAKAPSAAAEKQEATAVKSSSTAHAESEPTVHLPPPSAQWISRQCILHRHIFTVLQPHLVEEWKRLLNPHLIVSPAACRDMSELCARWLDREAVASRMAFAVQHADGIHHLLSLLLDAVVKVAYVATARSRAPLPASPSTGDGSSSLLEQDSSVYCAETLWYLFVLHDIVMNASNMSSSGAGTSGPSSCVNKNSSSAAASAHGKHSGGSGEAGDEDPLAATEGSAEALEALYVAFKHQQQQQQRSSPSPGSSASSSSAGGATSFLSTPPSPATGPPPLLPMQPHRPPPPPARRRQRTARRRSPYERCGDALELILPTLLEACTAVALAVSLDKERQPRSSHDGGDVGKPNARVHHFKVLRQPMKATENDAGAAQQQLASSGGPPLSLRLDAGCTAEAGCASSALSPSTTPDSGVSTRAGLISPDMEKQSSTESCNAAATTAGAVNASASPSSSSSSSASAVLLLEWMRSLVMVWMTAEQPLLLPLPDASAAASSASTSSAAPVSADLTWPNAQPGMSDVPDVKLAYFVKAPHAHVLGLEAGPSPHFSAQQLYEEPYLRQQPPLLSARACAILKERYSYLL